MARAGNVSGTDRSTGKVGAAGRQDAHPERLERILAADPRTRWPGRGIDDHAVPLATLRRECRGRLEPRLLARIKDEGQAPPPGECAVVVEVRDDRVVVSEHGRDIAPYARCEPWSSGP